MLKFFNANQKNSLKKLELILNKRKLKQQTKSAIVKKILFDVKKYGDFRLSFEPMHSHFANTRF